MARFQFSRAFGRFAGFSRGRLQWGLYVVVSLFVLLGASADRLNADSYAYEVSNMQEFGTIDLNTGVFTPISIQSVQLAGLGVANGNLYGGANLGTTLYQVNPINGSLTSVGNGTYNYIAFGSTTSGSGLLFGLYTANAQNAQHQLVPFQNLLSVNPTNGAQTTISGPNFQTSTVTGLSMGSSSLYYTAFGYLYTLNTTTGQATQAPMPLGLNGSIGALVFENGTLYGGATVTVNGVSVPEIVTIDTTTGVATDGVMVTGTTCGFDGLVPTLPTPEPGSLAILAASSVGLLAFGAVGRLFRRRPTGSRKSRKPLDRLPDAQPAC